MLDPLLRRWIDPGLDRVAAWLVNWRLEANLITLAGFAIGLLSLPLLAFEHYRWALLAILCNRLLDGLDGAVARRNGITDLGGYLDIVCDMLFYAACVMGFALARPENLLPAVLLLASFVGTATSFLAWAALAARRGLSTNVRGTKSIYYSAGLVEGTETIAAFVLMCLWPSAFAQIAVAFAVLCALTVLGRLVAARNFFAED